MKTKTLTPRKRLDTQVKKYIIEAIDSTNYDLKQPLISDEYKLRFLHKTFYKEYGWAIDNLGPQYAFREWLQGLPSCFNIDFENYRIIELAYAWGSIKGIKKAERLKAIGWKIITSSPISIQFEKSGISKTEIRKIKSGCWCFDIYYGRPYPNFSSAMYLTKKETMAKLVVYIETGKFDWYGSAE